MTGRLNPSLSRRVLASRKILLLGTLTLFATVLGFAQFRRGSGGGETLPAGYTRTEGGGVVNEDTVRTARETESHSTGTPNWTNAPGYRRDVFTFTRIIFKSHSGFDGRFSRGGSFWGWSNDYPDSDLNLSYRLQQLTSLKVDPDGRVLKLSDPELGSYPFIYMVKPGRMELRDGEVPLLRRYLLNGGSLMADDFWGTLEWENFEHEMSRVLPGHAWVELPMSHPLFHCVFDLRMAKNDLQVPPIHFYERSGLTSRNGEDSRDVHIRAWLDDWQRVMVIATHNTDNGDGWEREGENKEYFHEFSEKRAYPLGINIVFYLMTH